MATHDDDDILGEVDSEDVLSAPDLTGIQAVLAGVSVTWLMQAFKMDRRTVRQKLAPLPPIRMGRGNAPIYNFSQACTYLVKPNIDLRQYIQSLQPKDLPPVLQDAYWAARLKRQKWEENAGDLWRTTKVQEALADTFKTLKTTIQLFAGNIAAEEGLTPAQRKLLQQQLDGLQRDLHEALITQAKTTQTLSQLSELDDEDPAAVAALGDGGL